MRIIFAVLVVLFALWTVTFGLVRVRPKIFTPRQYNILVAGNMVSNCVVYVNYPLRKRIDPNSNGEYIVSVQQIQPSDIIRVYGFPLTKSFQDKVFLEIMSAETSIKKYSINELDRLALTNGQKIILSF